MEIGELLGSGRTADVYAIGDERVLRRYRIAIDAHPEAAIMAYVGRYGFPVPRVFPHSGSSTEIVMARLWGRTMLRTFADGDMTAEEMGGVLADLLRRLHEIPALASANPRDRVLHLDLHPDNVMLTPDGPVVIDWLNSREGPPGLDCAMSAVILGQVAVDTENRLAGAARAALGALLDRLGDAMDFGVGLDWARARRALDERLTEREVGLLGAAAMLIRAHRAS